MQNSKNSQSRSAIFEKAALICNPQLTALPTKPPRQLSRLGTNPDSEMQCYIHVYMYMHRGEDCACVCVDNKELVHCTCKKSSTAASCLLASRVCLAVTRFAQ